MLSIFGNDSEMAAVSGAISTNARLTAKLPDGQRLELFVGEKPTTYRGHLSIPAVSDPSGTSSASQRHSCRTAPMDQSRSFTMTTPSSGQQSFRSLGFPPCPVGLARRPNAAEHREDSGDHRIQLLSGHSDHHARGASEVDWLQVEKKYLSLPEVAGPIIWPVYGIKDLLSASVIEPDVPGIAA